jgi:hypothetical protein
MKRTTIGLDIAKRVFPAHAVDPESGEVRRTRLQRGEVLRHLAQMHPALVVMEACSRAQPKRTRWHGRSGPYWPTGGSMNQSTACWKPRQRRREIGDFGRC